MKNYRISKSEKDHIFEQYGIRVFTASIFIDGVMNDNILLETDKGKYVLRVYTFEHRIIDEIKAEVKLLAFLKKHNFPVPKIFTPKTGQIFKFKNYPAILFEYIEPDKKKITKKDLGKIGMQMGEYHSLVTNKNFGRDFHEDSSILGWIEREKNFITKKEILKKKDIEFLINEFKNVKPNKKLPMGYCHNDIHSKNLILSGNEIYWIDFADASYNFLISDIATTLHFTFQDRGIDANLLDTFINNYEKARKLSKLEKRSLYDSLRYVIILHLFYVITPSIKENTSRKQELAKKRLSFYKSIIKSKGKIEKIIVEGKEMKRLRLVKTAE